MKTLHSSTISRILVILLTVIERGVLETVRCPRYCTCYLNTTDNMRSVACVARRLDNIDLSIPKRVQTLDLSNNTISVLEDRGFQKLGLIEIVNLLLKHNSIKAVSLHTFAGLVYLKKVDLSGNYLYQILPWTFHDNSNLKFISLSGNPLGHITPSGPILDVPSLEVFELSHCNFGYFSEDAFTALPNLKRLDISHNQLISFDIYTIYFLHYLQELDISKNPWPCNTNMKNLRDFLESKSSKLKGSACDLGPTKVKENIITKSIKFEKIISVMKDSAEYENFENSEEHSRQSTENDDNSEESTKEKEEYETECDCNCDCRTEENNNVEGGKVFNIPPVWLVLISFQLGVCATLFLGYCCICCCSKRKKYYPLETTLPVMPDVMAPNTLPPNEHFPEIWEDATTETMPCPDTPPPSYRELFVT